MAMAFSHRTSTQSATRDLSSNLDRLPSLRFARNKIQSRLSIDHEVPLAAQSHVPHAAPKCIKSG
jgi:hypothetical protein